MKRLLLVLLVTTFVNASSFSQMLVDLYDNLPVPNSRPCDVKEVSTRMNSGRGSVTGVVRPTLQVFSPEVKNAAGTSVIICPGGGYSALAIDHEGWAVAKAFNAMGITAFVLKNRLPTTVCMEQPETGPLMDVEQAIKHVRENAVTYKIDASKIGIMGFSAGGHLASSLGTHYSEVVIANPKNTSLRPDFMVLIYPVISMKDSLTHRGSRNNLISRTPAETLVHRFSNEEQVTPKTPITFLVHAADDNVVVPANSISFFQTLLKNKVPAEMHIYQNGGHGFGLTNPTTKDEWIERLKNWFFKNELLK